MEGSYFDNQKVDDKAHFCYLLDQSKFLGCLFGYRLICEVPIEVAIEEVIPFRDY